MATSGTSTESSSMYSSADGDVVVSNVNLTSLSVNNYYSNGSSMTSHQSMLGGGSIGGKSNERLVVMDDEDDDDDQALIDKILPRELLLKVFSFLDVVSLCRAAQVSRAWNSLALDGSNWQRVDLFSFQTEVNSPVIQRLSSRTGGFLHAISLRGCRSLTDDALTELARSCPNLEVLDLNDCKNLTDVTCEAIATYCSNLVSLNLSGLSITDRSLHSLSTSEPLALKLSHLNLSFCSALTWRGLLKLLAGPASFQSSLSNNSSAASNATTTSTLTNNWTNGTASASSSTNNFFHSPSSSYHHHPHLHRQRRPYSALRFFAAKMCVNMITDTSVTALTWAAGSNLRTLLLNGCNNLTDEGVSAIGSNSPNLSTLALSSCTHLTDASLQSLASGTSQLKTLEVASCSQLTDAGVTALARGCHQLTRLDLEELVQLTDASISVLATQCPNLSTLSLSHCELITDEGLRALSQGTSNPPLLKVLELDNCPLITDEGLSHLSRLTSLQRLEIYDCQQLSRPGIRMIRAALPFLKIHAYFASVTPTQQANGDGQGIGGPGGGAGAGNPNDPLDPAHRAGRTICRCCSIL